MLACCGYSHTHGFITAWHALAALAAVVIEAQQQVAYLAGWAMNNDFYEIIKDLQTKIDQLQSKVDKMDVKLTKHIKFIDKTYEGLKSPIKTVTGFFGKKYD